MCNDETSGIEKSLIYSVFIKKSINVKSFDVSIKTN